MDFQNYSNYVFHVHTWRCGHASNEQEQEYIKKAINKGAECIVFTDHAPFPHDLFTGRMRFSELQGYISTLKNLKNEYRAFIDVKIGLEIEYLENFEQYYKDLKNNTDIDLMVLGQHHCEVNKGFYSYQLKDNSLECEYLLKSMIKAVRSGYFDVVAHPDRAFRHIKKWNDTIAALSDELIKETIKRKMYLEKNYKTKIVPEFWELVPPNTKIIYGSDAHSVNEIFTNSEIKKALFR